MWCSTSLRHKTSLIRLRILVQSPVAVVGGVQDDGLLVVRVAEVGREVRLQVLELARIRLATDARHVDAGALKINTEYSNSGIHPVCHKA